MNKLTLCIALFFTFCSVAIADNPEEYDAHTIGPFEYQVSSDWLFQRNSTNCTYYATKVGSPEGGSLFVETVASDLTEQFATMYMDIYQSIANRYYGTTVELIPVSVAGGNACIACGMFAGVYAPALFFSDGSYVYAISYANSYMSDEEANTWLLDYATTIRDTRREPITLSGSGTTICDPVSIPFSPARITFIPSEKAKFDITYMRGTLTCTAVEGNHTYSSAFLEAPGNYSFLVETSADWTMSVELLEEADFSPLSGSGDYVSDIYTFSEPVIVRITGEFMTLDNFVVEAYIEHSTGWMSTTLYRNLLGDAGELVSGDAILKIGEPSHVVFVVDFDGNWTLDIGE